MTLRLDEPHGGVWRNDKFIELTPYQFRLLRLLLRAESGFVSAKALADTLNTSKDSMVHQIHRLRKKLGEPKTIFYRYPWGYRIERDA